MSVEKTAKITVRVQPNAKRNEVVRFEDDVLYLRIAAPPVKGKANQALIAFLSDILGVSKSNLSIDKGATSRTKVITVEGLTQEETRERIENLLA
ncbi:MAG TPA: YggU family protein [Dehalococcoidia bacterium]|nr:YggU family protein [Dehalococcoidia bacterium]